MNEAGSASERKKSLRERMAAIRSGIPEPERVQRSDAICRHFLAAWSDALLDGRTLLAAYVPFRSEADVMPIVRWCWERSIAVAAPLADKASRAISLRLIAGEHELLPGTYGIREPEPAAPAAEPDPGTRIFMLVPGLAFDAAGRRLGYGGGYYDRLLEQHRAAANSGALTLIAPAFAAQIIGAVPTEPHDAAVRFLVTEAGVIDCSQVREQYNSLEEE